MPSIENIVRVQIQLGSQQVNRPGFGVGLILASFAWNPVATDRIRFYGSLTAVGADFATNSEVYKAATLYFGQSVQPTQLAIGRIDAGDADIVASIEAVRAESDDWYALAVLDHTEAKVLLAAAHIEALKKIFVTSTLDPVTLTAATTDIAAQLAALKYTRTATIWSAEAAKWPEAGWLGRMLPTDVGAATWKFKTIVGIVADNLTDTQFNYASGKKCNVYVSIAGVNITSEGVMASGEYIDVTRFVDWLQSTMEADVYSLLVNTDKVPYTNKGIAAIENILRSDLQAGVDNGGLAPDPAPSVSVPDALTVPLADKQSRTLNGITFAATLAGAIHKTQIQGYLSF
jgi:hypothetical protein